MRTKPKTAQPASPVSIRTAPHLLALVDHCADRSAWSLVRQLVSAGRDYFAIAGYWTDLPNLRGKGITAARTDSAAYAEAAFLNSLGNAYYSLGQVEEAIGYHKQVLAIAIQIALRLFLDYMGDLDKRAAKKERRAILRAQAEECIGEILVPS